MAKTLFHYDPDWSQGLSWSMAKEVNIFTSRQGVEQRISRYAEKDFVRKYEIRYTTHNIEASSALENTLLSAGSDTLLLPNWFEVFYSTVSHNGLNIFGDKDNFQNISFCPLARGDLSTQISPVEPGYFRVLGEYYIFRFNQDDYYDNYEYKKLTGWNTVGSSIVFSVESPFSVSIPLGSQAFCFLDEVVLGNIQKNMVTDLVHTYQTEMRSVYQ